MPRASGSYGRLAGRQAGWLAGRLAGWQAGWLAGRQAGWLTDEMRVKSASFKIRYRVNDSDCYFF